MLTHPKCKDCGHSKTKHRLVNIFTRGKRKPPTPTDICWDCHKFFIYGPTYEWEVDMTQDDIRPYHLYRPDNLGYLERKYEKFEKANRHNQSSQEVAG